MKVANLIELQIHDSGRKNKRFHKSSQSVKMSTPSILNDNSEAANNLVKETEAPTLHNDFTYQSGSYVAVLSDDNPSPLQIEPIIYQQKQGRQACRHHGATASSKGWDL